MGAHTFCGAVGDMTYARPQDRPEAAPRMMLHAQALTLPFKPKQVSRGGAGTRARDPVVPADL